MRSMYVAALCAVLVAACADAPVGPPTSAALRPSLDIVYPGGQECTIRPGREACVPFSGSFYPSPEIGFYPFSYDGATWPQRTIRITVSPRVQAFCAWANDVDLPGTRVRYLQANAFWVSYQFPARPPSNAFSQTGFCINHATSGFVSFEFISGADDYVNWNFAFKRNNGDPTWCRMQDARVSCGGVTATAQTSFTPTNNLGAFYTPYTDTEEVNFGAPLYKVEVTAIDVDVPGTYMTAYDVAGVEVGRVDFTPDNVPTRYTQETRSITSSAGIRRIRLVSGDGDDVAFKGLVATISGPPPAPPEPLSAFISGESEVAGGSGCTWSASVSGGVAPYTYSWWWDFTNLVGTDRVYSRYFPTYESSDGDELGHLELIVTDAEGTTYYPDGMSIYRNDSAGNC